MQAINRQFTKIINGTTQFVIPVFQRDYSWTEANCDQLWRDIHVIALDTTERAHFLGSLVYVSTGDSSAGFTRWLLIDGQQRLTTLTLLLIAMRDHILESGWVSTDDGPTVKRLNAYFLKNVQEEGAREHKLVLRRHDQATLQALVDRTDPPITVSERIRDNYEYFREQLRGSDPEVVYRGIGRLEVVDVTLDRGTDDPQLIFESLNSTGVDLSQSDLIRNFILMRLDEKEQTRLYQSYWGKIEALFRGHERTFDGFVRDFIALQTQASKQEKADEIYAAFRRQFGAIGSNVEKIDQFLQQLLRYARYHAAFSLGKDAPTVLRDPFARLRRLADVPATLVMRLYDYHDHGGTLSLDEFARAVSLVESYVFRRAICGEQTRGYWQIFANLAYRTAGDKPLESLSVGLARLPDSYRYPTDEEFRKALEERDIYHKRVCLDLLDRLENHDNKEPSDTSKYSIEHIMPQNEKLIPAWRSMLGEHWQEVQREWLHRLGNLTLTGYNGTYSDRSFEDKKSIAGGFSDSSVRLNKFVRDQPVWTEQEMQTRTQALASKALAIWPGLAVDKKLIDQAQEAEMRDRALRRDVMKVPMTQAARELFDLLRGKLREIDPNVIELAEQKTVSYHAPLFFLEVLPRKNQLGLLLAIDFNEIGDSAALAADASQKKFIVNAEYEGGVYVSVRTAADIEKALPIIRQARDAMMAMG